MSNFRRPLQIEYIVSVGTVWQILLPFWYVSIINGMLFHFVRPKTKIVISIVRFSHARPSANNSENDCDYWGVMSNNRLEIDFVGKKNTAVKQRHALNGKTQQVGAALFTTKNVTSHPWHYGWKDT